jgi:glucosamine 6-phosphate synthetase-like amidotransferase/phosphosugar isomerase protein
MCGIAGYSFSAASDVDRTLAAQALLAGIAERGADAVRVRVPRARRRVHDGGEAADAASSLLERISVPGEATQLLVHVRDYTKGHPSIAANNHPVRHGPVVGIHNGIIANDDELARAPRLLARRAADDRVTIPPERGRSSPSAAHSRNHPRALEELHGTMAAAWFDDARAGRPLCGPRHGPPLWIGRGKAEHFLRIDPLRA